MAQSTEVVTYRLEYYTLRLGLGRVSEKLIEAACDGDANLKFPDKFRKRFVIVADDPESTATETY